MRDNTRNKLIETGAAIIHLKGFNNTGIQEILEAADVPKGSFYNYFRNKEDFGLQVVDFFVEYIAHIAAGVMGDLLGFAADTNQEISCAGTSSYSSQESTATAARSETWRRRWAI